MRYTGFNWKVNTNTDVQIIREKQPINAPPMANTKHIATTTDIYNYASGTHTPFKANPLKHWRKQYGTTAPPNMGRPVKVKQNIAIIDQPGYTTISGATVNPDCNDLNKCQSSPVEPDYMVAYRNKDAKDNTFGHGVKIIQRNQGNQYERCVSVCDPERAARRRTQYPSIINSQVYTNNNELCYNKSKYNQSNSEYLKSRCRTYTQNMASKKAGPPAPWGAAEDTCVNCQPDCGSSSGCGSVCKTHIFKANNYKFSQQGAVSSSSASFRKKYNTINRFANQFTKPSYKGLYGDATAAAYTYSGNSNTPFTIKDKTYTELQCRTNSALVKRNYPKKFNCSK